jgi:Amt family ammonium transporter
MSNLTMVEEQISAIQESLKSLDYLIAGTDVFYTLYCGSLIFLMQCGFAMLCAGSVRQKNVKNIMLKNILDACGGALGFWSIGFALAYGSDGKFVGVSTEKFFLNDYSGGAEYIDFFFQFTFAATAATIVAGTVAERCKMQAYLFYSVFLTAFVYPVVVHAIWNGDGFLSALNETDKVAGIGMVDFAGSGVVHMTGGATALIAAIILGPRIGRFYDADGNALDKPADFPAHSVALQVLGTFLLWFGWYGFNPGSTLSISPKGYGDIAALCAVTTTISAATGAVSALFIDTVIGMATEGEAEYDLTMAMNGALSGLVGITANCSVVAPWAAFMIGLVAGLVYVMSSALLVKLKIDDAVDAIPVHFFNGIWGCIATGIFADPNRVEAAYGTTGYGGFLYGKGGASLLGAEIAGVLFIIGWVGGIMTPFFLALNSLGMFRVDAMEEKVGLDISHHKGAAYDLTGPSKADVDELAEKRATAHGKTEKFENA